MEIDLIRHGETFENKNHLITGQLPGVLTPEGFRQAEEVAAKLAGNIYAQIYCSDLARCVATAEPIIGTFPTVPVVFTPQLREFNMGEYNGREVTPEVRQDLDFALEHPEHHLPGGESINDLQSRITEILTEIQLKFLQEKVLVITHSTVIKNFLSIVFQKPIHLLQPAIHINNADVVGVNLSENLTGSLINGSGVFFKNPENTNLVF